MLKICIYKKRKKKKENPSSTCEYPCEQAKPGHKDGHRTHKVGCMVAYL